MKYLLLVFASFSLLTVTSCENESPSKRDWPDVKTFNVTDISDKGAVFSGEIFSGFEIMAYGFVWSEYKEPLLGNSDKIYFHGNLQSGVFSAEISTTLEQGKTYFVKSFVKTSDYTVYGASVNFKSLGSQPPVITSFFPETGNWNDTIRIYGAHFSYLNRNNSVMFGAIPATVISSTDSLLITTVPSAINNETVPINISVCGNKAVSGTQFAYVKPKISGVFPLSGTFDDLVTITGSDFSPLKEKDIVKFDNHVAQVIEASKTSLIVKVPREINHENSAITVSVNQLLSYSDFSYKLLRPGISSIAPDAEFIGGIIQINGSNFNPLPTGDSVLFDGNPGVIQSVTNSTIMARVPSGIYKKRALSVEVKVAGLTARSPVDFSLKNTWIRKADVPHQGYSRYCASAFSIKNYGYVGLGYGYTGSNFWKYDPQSNAWSEIVPFPGNDRNRAACFVISDKAYVGLGGVNLHDFWRYDPSVNNWTRISDFPASNVRAVGLSYNNKGYIITDGSSSNFWEYDASSDSWSKKTDCPAMTGSVRFNPDAGFVISDKIYLYATDGSTRDNQLWEYSFSTDTWTRKADLVNSGLDMYSSGFSLNGKGYIRGNAYLFQYDPLNNSWIALPQGKNVPGTSRTRSVAFTINNLAYFGTSDSGWGIGDYLYDLWEFNPDYL